MNNNPEEVFTTQCIIDGNEYTLGQDTMTVPGIVRFADYKDNTAFPKNVINIYRTDEGTSLKISNGDGWDELKSNSAIKVEESDTNGHIKINDEDI